VFAGAVDEVASPSQAMFARYLGTALASAAELEYQLLLARAIQLLPADTHASLHRELTELRRMLVARLKRVRDRGRPPTYQPGHGRRGNAEMPCYRNSDGGGK